MNQISFCQIRWAMRMAEHLKRKIEWERDGAVRITSCMSRIPKDRRCHSRIEESVVEIVDLENDLDRTEAKLKEMREALDFVIGFLHNPNDRVLLRLRYMKGFSPEEIAERSHHTVKCIYHALGRAEREMIRIFPEMVNK